MKAAEQLTFWEEPITEEKIIWMEIEDLKTKQNNLRRGLFGRFDELQKEIELLRNQILFLISQKME